MHLIFKKYLSGLRLKYQGLGSSKWREKNICIYSQPRVVSVSNQRSEWKPINSGVESTPFGARDGRGEGDMAKRTGSKTELELA